MPDTDQTGRHASAQGPKADHAAASRERGQGLTRPADSSIRIAAASTSRDQTSRPPQPQPRPKNKNQRTQTPDGSYPAQGHRQHIQDSTPQSRPGQSAGVSQTTAQPRNRTPEKPPPGRGRGNHPTRPAQTAAQTPGSKISTPAEHPGQTSRGSSHPAQDSCRQLHRQPDSTQTAQRQEQTADSPGRQTNSRNRQTD